MLIPVNRLQFFRVEDRQYVIDPSDQAVYAVKEDGTLTHALPFHPVLQRIHKAGREALSA